MRRCEWRSGKARRSRLVTPIIGQAAGVGQGLARGHPDAEAGEHARAEVDGDRADVAQLDPRLAAQELDGGRERLGVAAAAGGVDGAEHALVAADGAAHLGGGGGDAEDQHQAATRPRRRARRPARRARAAHAGPTGRKASVAVVVAGAEGEAHLEVVVRAAPGGWRRPTR